jgi:hypothetical protein
VPEAAGTTRLVAWMKADPPGAETARVELAPDSLRATGVAIGSDPEPYRLDCELKTSSGFLTRRVLVRTVGAGTRSDGGRVVRFESVGEGEDLLADIVFDADGLVLDYPGIATAVHPGAA